MVAILSTGNELVDLQSDANEVRSSDGWGGIYDTNRPSLQAVLQSMGYEVVDLGIVVDEYDFSPNIHLRRRADRYFDSVPSHIGALQKGLEMADLIITTGGTSMGPTDLLKPVIERYLNGTIHFGRVGIKPGKPTTFATVAVSQGNQIISKPIFALPGNPASALVTYYIFVVPALRRLGGWPEKMCGLPRVQVEVSFHSFNLDWSSANIHINMQVQNPMPLDPRVEFHRAIIKSSIHQSSGGTGSMILKAYSTGGQRSSRVASLCEANGLVILPSLTNEDDHQDGSSKKTALNSGEVAQAILIGEVEME